MAFKSDKQRKGFFSTISSGGNASVRKIQKKDKIIKKLINDKKMSLPISKYKRYLQLRENSRNATESYMLHPTKKNAFNMINHDNKYGRYVNQLKKDYSYKFKDIKKH